MSSFLSPEQRAQLDAAKSRLRDNAIQITTDVLGTPMTFDFLPSINHEAMDVIWSIEKLSDRETSKQEQIKVILDFLDAMAFPDTEEMIAELFKDGAIDVAQLVKMQQEVVEAATARPTTRSSSSSTGLPESGPSSTASLAQPVLTPPPSPSVES